MADAAFGRLKRVFEEALDLPPDARAAFLDQACGPDSSLRQDVESMIASHEQAGTFLDHPARLVDEAAAASWIGRRVGPYRIVAELGRGGMGTVFRAVRDDETFAKEVALKLVRGGLTSELLQRRFHRERQILARLQHAHIASVLDGGTTDDGQPYLVLEYVDGEPIDRYCATRALSTGARLAMFRQVCAAVHYAHQNLVVHRDLKPANVLVTADGTPKLLDFGIAKLLSTDVDADSAPTATILPMMTPEYASPEQVRGESISTASDIYSLGILLCEVLTGQRPYGVRTDSLEQIVRAVCEAEPAAPSALVATGEGAPTRPSPTTASELRGDLDTIVLKALRKEPARRYGSAHELSEDIRRHLVGLPVLARPDTVRYRAGKFVGRHKAGVAGALAAALIVVGFAVNTSIQSARVRRERDTAERVSQFLVRLFEVADPGEGANVTTRQILDRGVERVRGELKDEPEVRARLMDTMGNVYKSLALYDQAEPLLREALETQKRLLGDHVDVARTNQHLAVLLWRKGEYDEAEKLLREGLVLQRRIQGEDHPSVASTMVNLASVLAEKGDAAEAEQLYRDALAIQRRADPKSSNMPNMIENLAISLMERAAYAEAEPLFLEALALKRELLGAEHPSVGRGLDTVGGFLEEKGDYAGAERHYREALVLLRKSFGNEHRWVAVASSHLAGILGARGDVAAAEVLAREAVARQRTLLGNRHPAVAGALGGLGWILLQKGDPAAAEPLFREALAMARDKLGGENVEVAGHEVGLAAACTALGRLDVAEALYRHALATSRTVLGDRHASVAAPLTGLGELLMQKGDAAAAEGLLREALEIGRMALPADHPDTAERQSLLGACLAAQGRFADAEPLLRDGHAGLEAKTTSRSRETRDARARLQALYQAWGRPDDARRYAALAVD